MAAMFAAAVVTAGVDVYKRQVLTPTDTQSCASYSLLNEGYTILFTLSRRTPAKGR